MSFFDDDPFDDVFEQFFGNQGIRRRASRRVINEDEERTVDFIEGEEFTYLIFELSGFDKEDISVKVDGRNIIIQAKKKQSDDIREYLYPKLSQGIIYERDLPEKINVKGFEYTFNNGILEVKFRNRK